MSLPSFITHCLHCNSLCEQRVFLASLPIVCIVTPCVNMSLPSFITHCLHCNSLCEQ
ncbi:hypothetical protein KSS87_004325 [Heliosperma pusillum]|nr:hypothetical protein KSS87_004325 [Heliosperma pusillum]